MPAFSYHVQLIDLSIVFVFWIQWMGGGCNRILERLMMGVGSNVNSDADAFPICGRLYWVSTRFIGWFAFDSDSVDVQLDYRNYKIHFLPMYLFVWISDVHKTCNWNNFNENFTNWNFTVQFTNFLNYLHEQNHRRKMSENWLLQQQQQQKPNDTMLSCQNVR